MFGLGKKKAKKEESVKENIKEENITPVVSNKDEDVATAVIAPNNEDVTLDLKTEGDVIPSASVYKHESEKTKEEKKAEKEAEKNEPVPITYKEIKALKRADYEKIAPKYKTAYILKNKKTGQVVEIRAASSFHACNIIGWRPNRVKLMAQRIIENPPALPDETTGQSVAEKVLPPALI